MEFYDRRQISHMLLLVVFAPPLHGSYALPPGDGGVVKEASGLCVASNRFFCATYSPPSLHYTTMTVDDYDRLKNSATPPLTPTQQRYTTGESSAPTTTVTIPTTDTAIDQQPTNTKQNEGNSMFKDNKWMLFKNDIFEKEFELANNARYLKAQRYVD